MDGHLLPLALLLFLAFGPPPPTPPPPSSAPLGSRPHRRWPLGYYTGPLSVGVAPTGILKGPSILPTPPPLFPSIPATDLTRCPGCPPPLLAMTVAVDPMIVFDQFPRRLKEIATRGCELFVVGSTPWVIQGGKTTASPCCGSIFICREVGARTMDNFKRQLRVLMMPQAG